MEDQANSTSGMTVGRIANLGHGLPTAGQALSRAVAANPREVGEIDTEVQGHHDLVGLLAEEIEMLEAAVAPVSQMVPPNEGKDPGVSPRMSRIGAQLQADNLRLHALIGRIRSIRSNLVI